MDVEKVLLKPEVIRDWWYFVSIQYDYFKTALKSRAFYKGIRSQLGSKTDQRI